MVSSTLGVLNQWMSGASRKDVRYKGRGLRFYIRTKSRLVAKGFAQIQDVDHQGTTSPTPASVLVKLLAVVEIDLGLLVFHLDRPQAFFEASLEKTYTGMW